MNGFPDGGLDGFGGLCGLNVDLDAGGMFELQVGPVDGGVELGTQVDVADVADDTDDGDVGLDIAGTIGDQMAESVLGRAEETFCEGKIDDCDFGSSPWRQQP